MRGALRFRVCLGLVGVVLVGCPGDEACKTATPWYEDRDGDGFGSDADQIVSCDAPIGYVDNSEDCDDRDAVVYPGATEVCGDGEVNACEGTAEEASASCAVGAVASAATTASLTLTGAAAGDGMGSAVAGVGDADGDGVFDVLVGAPGAGGAGRVYLFWGSATGDASLDDASATFVGESDGDGLGAVVGAAGDINSDREGDLLLGAPAANSDAGALWVFSHGISGEVALTEADGIIRGAAAGDLAASALAVGDRNDDGDTDFFLGAPGAEDGAGHVNVVYGPLDGEVDLADESRTFYGESAGANLGAAVLAMDLDADGTDDLVMGAPHALLTPSEGQAGDTVETGILYMYRSVLTTPTSVEDADVKLFGETALDLVGGTLCNLGDTDGDGYEDLAVGAPGQNSDHLESGSVYLVLGPVAEHTYTSLQLAAEAKIQGALAGDHAGSALAAGDLNGDGAPDLIIGVPGDDTAADGAGAVYTLLSPVSDGGYVTDLASHQLLGEAESDGVGTAVSAVGDLDGDGISELLIGAPTAGGGAGVAWLARLAGY